MNQESGGNASAISSAGAVGLFQLMPSSFPGVNIQDPVTNIDTGVAYLAQLLNQYNGDTSLALAAYNAGPGNVAKYGGIPPFSETQNYVASILSAIGMDPDTSTDSSGNTTVDVGQTISDAISSIDPTTLGIIAGVVGIGLYAILK
jgi:Transglycosylase SLT domain